MKSRDSIVRSTGIISASTIASRVLGLVRDSMLGAFFTNTFRVPFLAAFILPNTLRRLFAEGALSAAFIPVFTECLHKDGPQRAARLGASMLKVLFLFLLLVSVLGSVFAPQILDLLTLKDMDESQYALTSRLLRIMFPYILVIGLSAATMGMLNSLGRFFAPAISPALLNIAMISCMVIGYWLTRIEAIRLLAYGVLAGGSLQFLVQFIPLNRQLPLNLTRSPLWDPRMKRVLWLMLPLIFGQAITEVNILVSTYLFAINIKGAVSYLFFSNRIIQFPLGVFGIAIATATFPKLSRDAIGSEDSRRAVADTATYALKKILFIMLPSAVGIMLLGRDIFGAILNRGAFLREGSLEPTYICAIAYCFGLPAFASVKIVVSAFYARQNTRTPTIVGFFAVAINIILLFVLSGPLGAPGLALATTLSSYCNFLILTGILTRRLHQPLFRPLGEAVARSGLAALGMGVGLWLVEGVLPTAESRFLLYVLRLAILLPVGIGFYAAFSWWMQRDEMRIIVDAFAKRFRK